MSCWGDKVSGTSGPEPLTANMASPCASPCVQISLFMIITSSVTQLCPTLCSPMDCSTPGLPVHHQLLEFTQTHVHRVSDAIQPSHPWLSPSPLAFNLSQHQGLFMSQLFTSSCQNANVADLGCCWFTISLLCSFLSVRWCSQ